MVPVCSPAFFSVEACRGPPRLPVREPRAAPSRCASSARRQKHRAPEGTSAPSPSPRRTPADAFAANPSASLPDALYPGSGADGPCGAHAKGLAHRSDRRGWIRLKRAGHGSVASRTRAADARPGSSTPRPGGCSGARGGGRGCRRSCRATGAILKRLDADATRPSSPPARSARYTDSERSRLGSFQRSRACAMLERGRTRVRHPDRRHGIGSDPRSFCPVIAVRPKRRFGAW